MTPNDSDQRLATAGLATVQDSIASPLHRLVRLSGGPCWFATRLQHRVFQGCQADSHAHKTMRYTAYRPHYDANQRRSNG